MNHLLIAPILLPALMAPILLLALRFRLGAARAVSLLSTAALLGFALVLVAQAATGRVESYALGDWPAPFGIVLVLDRLSALMVCLTALLAMLVLWHAVATGLDKRGWHFHPLFQFQLLGLNGAFLTGDLFNLFVFFEVLLIASYGLMLHGQGPARLKAGIHYVVVNLVGSTLFLIALGLLYGSTGTLNMADMAERVAAATPDDRGLIAAGAAVLTVVFALKAAVVPLHLWLPVTYASTSAPAAALFAILTKVGVYALVRSGTLIFPDGPDAVSSPAAYGLLPAALLTVVVGFVGMLASHHLREMAAYAVLGSTGTLLASAALFEPMPLAATLYYLPHSTFSTAALFLLADLVARRRAGYGDALAAGPSFAGAGGLGILFFLAALAAAGLPPLSGFVGKLLILDAVRVSPAWPWIWGTILMTTLIGVLALARAGSVLFWNRRDGEPIASPEPLGRVAGPVAGLLLALAALTLFAGPAADYARATADQLARPMSYVEAVLGPGE
ncbi:monovalent cation/H+ antiporter subunit D [Rubellimicrobium roseum]|uniref:Monovalent cation/H+ antiporter subunit D n=1 Tax=Rubellimicrobium roseum TaxID=687525 RepID=A0A5C4N3R2_9RHOB|nr:monovalent cation/H+ antiporter subunit D [Rubellimicrobium roseum]TNC61047.1 monovalent cation/H+ antiporter subunit D [Rubellimicrobium roseum]